MATVQSDKILVVDDDAAFLRLLTMHLNSLGYETQSVASAKAALRAIESFHPALVITDLRMEEMDGIGLLEQIREAHPGLPVILVTAHGTIPDAVEATHRGAFGFLTKPVHKGQLREQISNALKIARPVDAANQFGRNFIYRSKEIAKVLRTAATLSSSDSNVLITGAPGTGKRLLARQIHGASHNAAQALVSLPCGDLDSTDLGVLDEQLRSGNCGALVMEDIDKLSGRMQAEVYELLNRLGHGLMAGADPQFGQHSGQAVSQDIGMGEEQVERINRQPTFRIVATATDKLAERVENGTFSPQVYYGMKMVEINMPSLAERREDIPSLADHFLMQHAQRLGSRSKSFSPAAIDMLVAFDWQNNVAQLSTAVEQCAVLTTGPVITDATAREVLGKPSDTMPSFAEARDSFTRNYLTRLMTLTDGNVSRAARLAKRNRTEFYKLLARFSVEPRRFKPGAQQETDSTRL